MGTKEKSKGLGRGLASLIPSTKPAPLAVPDNPEKTTQIDGEDIHYVTLGSITPNPMQPRHQWDQEKLDDLAQSIKTSGLLQPLLVRPAGQAGHYELIAGERRFRALKLAGIDRAPVIVRRVDQRDSLELALVENIQREELNPIDEAQAFQRLIKEFNYSQEELSNRVGRDRSTVTNSLRLLNLPSGIQKNLAQGLLTAGHARALLSLDQDGDRTSLEKLIIHKGLSVRQTEKMVREARERRTRTRAAKPIDPQVRFLEEGLMASLGTKVSVKHRGKRGKIEIEYYSLSDLQRLVEKIQGKQ